MLIISEDISYRPNGFDDVFSEGFSDICDMNFKGHSICEEIFFLFSPYILEDIPF